MKRKKIVVWLGIIILLTAGILSAGIYVMKRINERNEIASKPKPEDTFWQYVNDLRALDFEHMYQLIDVESSNQISEADFIARNKNIYGGIQADNFQVEILETLEFDDGTASVSYDISFDSLAGQIRFANGVLLTKDEAENYKIVWKDSMILHNLSAVDKVKVATLKAKRGQILDRNGVMLAGDGTASMVGLVPGKMNGDAAEDIGLLGELLGLSTESINKKLHEAWVKEDSFVPLKTLKKVDQLNLTSVSPDEVNLNNSLLQESLLAVPGVMISDTTVRTYPLGEQAAHLVGYVQKVTAEDLEKHQGEGYREDSVIGRSGMETLYEKELKGVDGKEIAIYDASGEKKEIVLEVPKIEGEDIRLTIDAGLQQQLYHTFSQDKSCSVAMNPYTGEVLALVSTPSYDNNQFILGMSNETWTQLNEDENKPLYNRFRQKWSPGSSLKPIIGAIGLDTFSITPQQDLGRAGLRWQKDSSWGNYFVTTLHESDPANLKNALVLSDNIYFAKTALNIGAGQLEEQLDALGFNQKLPFEITMAKSQYSAGDHIASEVQLADSGYGQGEVLINPLHLAALYTAFLNDGNIIGPYLRYQPERSLVTWISAAFTAENAGVIKEYMIETVRSEHGTGHGLYRSDLELAAKTGTAEIKLTQQDTAGTELGWLAVFPTDPDISNPLVLISMVEDVKGRGGSGYVLQKVKTILDNQY